MTRLTAPCKGCEERSADPNCHIYCEKYVAYKKARDQEKAEHIRIAKQEQILNDIEKSRKRRFATGTFRVRRIK